MKPVSDLSHDEIAVVAANKLSSMGYIATMANVTAGVGGEQPDAIGIKSCGESFLVEVKISKHDFIADRKKTWRSADFAHGHYRAFLTPKELLDPAEIPYGWQLWEVHGKTRPVVKIIKGMVKKKQPGSSIGWTAPHYLHCDADEYHHFLSKADYRGMLGLMATVLSRIANDGIPLDQYANRGGKGFLTQKKTRT